MKIGIVCYPSIGGSGIVATNLGHELAIMGHEIHFISYDSPFLLCRRHKNIFFHKVHINEYNLFKYPDYTLPLAVEIEQVQRKFTLDVVHVHYAVPHATAALLARRIMRQNNTPLPRIVTTLHGTDITLLARDKSLFDIIKYSIERSHGVTAVSKSLRDDTYKILKTKKDIEVIYNFYTPKAITKSRAQVRKGLKIRDNDFIAIHMSNLRPVKKVADLLKVTARLKRRPDFKLLILAGGDFSECEKLVKKLGIASRVIVKNNVTDIQNYINASDVGVYTSETESFGMGILETMSYGRPVLATAAGGVPEVIDDKKSGFLMGVGDVNGFAEKLKLLMNNKNLLQKMGQAAKNCAREKFSAKKIVPQYLEYYKKILKDK
jgi:N-acetyl-alpha-D-glucosaminyl L-malate synthase BshA